MSDRMYSRARYGAKYEEFAEYVKFELPWEALSEQTPNLV
jgi:hypothetical protein